MVQCDECGRTLNQGEAYRKYTPFPGMDLCMNVCDACMKDIVRDAISNLFARTTTREVA